MKCFSIIKLGNVVIEEVSGGHLVVFLPRSYRSIALLCVYGHYHFVSSIEPLGNK